MPLRERSARQKLLDLLLGQKLEDYLVAQRDAGLSWRRIEHDLLAKTGELVSWESLRRWHTEAGLDATEAEA